MLYASSPEVYAPRAVSMMIWSRSKAFGSDGLCGACGVLDLPCCARRGATRALCCAATARQWPGTKFSWGIEFQVNTVVRLLRATMGVTGIRICLRLRASGLDRGGVFAVTLSSAG